MKSGRFFSTGKLPVLFNIALAGLLCTSLHTKSAPAAAQPVIHEAPGEVISAAIPAAWPPHYIARPGEEPTGFAVEILNAVAQRAGYRVSYRVTETVGEAYDLTVAGEVDLMPNVGIIPARKDLFAFTEPVETFVVSIFVRADSQDIKSAADLAGRRVAVVERNIGLKLMSPRADVESVIFDDIRSALFDLVAGRVDALIYPTPVLLDLASMVGIAHRIKTVGQPLLEVKRGIAVHPSRTEIHRRLNAAVADFTGTPEYQRIYVRWFGRPPGFWTVGKVLMIAGGGLLFIVVAFTLWHYRTAIQLNRALEGRVEQRTSELRKAQAELLRKERLAALGELTGTVAHELRNPLGAVVAAHQVIKHKTADAGLDLATCLARAERNIDRCTGIIDDLLDYAQVKTVQRQSTDIDALIREIAKEYVRPDQIDIELALEHGSSPVDVDPERFRRIMLNFLDNASQAIGEKRAVNGEASAGRISIRTRAEGNGVQITVSDDGAGIPDDVIDNVFEPLFSTKSFGVGLGLPNAQNIVTAHGGTIGITSEVGKGTDIVVWLPEPADQEASPEPAAA